MKKYDKMFNKSEGWGAGVKVIEAISFIIVFVFIIVLIYIFS